MLKECLILALAAFGLSAATATGFDYYKTKTADMDFLLRQRKVYELFFYINQNVIMDSEMYQVGHSYSIENNMDFYTNTEFVKEFLTYYKMGFLNRGAIFSPYYEEHRREVYYLFRMFYYAKDFATFYKTACWARLHMNEGLFVYAFSAAIFQRQDCRGFRLPPPYEIFPNLYFDSKVIQEAYRIKMSMGRKSMDSVNSYMIYSNYSSYYTKPYHYYDNEYKMDYYFEDVGLNSYYYMYRQVFPFWMNSKEFNIPFERRGDMYFYMHQQLLARYYLERLSNGMGEIEDFDFYKPFATGFYSNLMYPNGVSMPMRSYYQRFPVYRYKYIKEYEALEFRIMSAIDSGFIQDRTGKQVNIYTPEGFNILGSIIEGNYDSYNRNYYGSVDVLARDILGFGYNSYNKNHFIPGALQTYSTSMRDPAFYRMYKRILMYFYRYKRNMPVYTQNELAFNGVKFESVNMDKLYTYFDFCDAYVNNAINVESWKEGFNLRIKARQYCLNYKPFTYRFQVNSDKDTKGMLRIFLGPAFEDMQYFEKNYYNFVELDQFPVTLKQGVNNFERRSTDSAFTMSDDKSFYKKIQNAIEGNEPYAYGDKFYGFPQRLYLPKGQPEGVKYKFFFYLSPLEETTKNYAFEFPYYGKIYANLDSKPWGYPLDRPPYYPWYFTMGNMYFKDAYVYHQTEVEKTVF